MKTIIYTLSALLVLAACSNGQQPAAVVPHNPSASNPPQTLPQTAPQPETALFFNQAAAPVAQTGFLANPNVQAFIRYHSQNSGLNPQYLNDFFARVQYRAGLINTMNRPSTSQPWYVFGKNNSGAAKINAGKAFYRQHRAVIDRAAAQYGVPPEIIVAILGIETNYGKNTGNVRVADALATLAFDYPRRGAYFQSELAEFLKLAQEERRDPFGFSGSFAGAMGMPQFMPQSFRRFAVDFDGNGQRDIWRSVPDVAASVANYMKQHGWQSGGRMMIPATAPDNAQTAALADEKTALNYTVAQLRQFGIQPQQPVGDRERAFLFRLETAPGQYRYYIGLNNFYTVWQYNHSRMYVTAVRDIANGIGSGGL